MGTLVSDAQLVRDASTANVGRASGRLSRRRWDIRLSVSAQQGSLDLINSQFTGRFESVGTSVRC